MATNYEDLESLHDELIIQKLERRIQDLRTCLEDLADDEDSGYARNIARGALKHDDKLAAPA